MKNEHTTLLVIGGGPGGYVAAIRAGQLGIPTVLVERDRLGGTCLNIGCIPSKALIHVADAFEQARGHAGEAALGIRVRTPEIDIAKSVAWKDGIVDRLTRGVGALLKKNGVRVLHGESAGGRRQDRRRRRRRPYDAHQLRAPVARDRLRAGRAAVDAVRRACRVVHRGAVAETLPKRLVVVGAGYIGPNSGSSIASSAST